MSCDFAGLERRTPWVEFHQIFVALKSDLKAIKESTLPQDRHLRFLRIRNREQEISRPQSLNRHVDLMQITVNISTYEAFQAQVFPSFNINIESSGNCCIEH